MQLLVMQFGTARGGQRNAPSVIAHVLQNTAN
jgi:hypothetical protein